jgi:hypothetical protein
MTNQNQELIGKYVSRVLYSDVQIVGKIIAIKGKSTIVIQSMNATKQTEELDFQVGGFFAHCSNQNNQKWQFEEEQGRIEELRLGKKFDKWYSIDNFPRHFYDYNF